MNNDEPKKEMLSLVRDFRRWEKKAEMYKDIPIQNLIDKLILTEMELEGINNDAMELWYFVGDETGSKYLSDEKPKVYFTVELDDSFLNRENQLDTVKPKKVLMTEGEINIRVPRKMETMFPEIKYGDEPILVKVSNITF